MSNDRTEVARPVVHQQGLHVVAMAMLIFCATLMMYAGNMSGSTALFACAALFMSDIALGVHVRTREMAAGATSRTHVDLAALLLPAVLVALTAWGLPHQFSDMAFVSGLLVAVVSIPVVLISFIAGRLLRRASASAADHAVHKRGMIRLAALAASLVAGVLAFQSFSAIPDALVTIPIVLLAATNVVAIFLRGTSTAAARSPIAT
ncbi:MAG: hypothetical protein H7123_03790 [Thermoleophilia bacterium]|nr:hypothetical protein [Thermoleophilia bacterium]